MNDRNCENIGDYGGSCRHKQYVFAGNVATGEKAHIHCKALNASILLNLDFMSVDDAQWHTWRPLTPDKCPMKFFEWVL
jgi:hypothetical protein